MRQGNLMIFDEDEEDEDGEKEGNSSKSFDEVDFCKKIQDPKSDPDMQRYDCRNTLLGQLELQPSLSEYFVT